MPIQFQPLTLNELLTFGFSVVAIVVSVLSFWQSKRSLDRDSANLIVTSHVVYDRQTKKPVSIKVRAVNAGRRPLIISDFVGIGSDGVTVTISIDEGRLDPIGQEGVELLENHRWGYSLTNDDTFHVHEDGGTTDYMDIQLMDTIGKKYPIAEMRRNLILFRKQEARA